MRKRSARSSTRLRSKSTRSSSVSHRRVKKRSRNLKKLTQVAVFVLVVGISFLFILGLGIYRNLNKNFASADSPNYYNISEQDIFTVLYVLADDISDDPVIIKELSMVFFDKKNNKLIRYKVDPNITMDIPGKFGEEPLFNVFALGSLNSENEILGGMGLMGESMSKMFGYKVDRYLLLDSTLESNMNELFSTGNLGLKLGPAKTDLTLSEFYGLVKFINSLPSDRLIEKTVDSASMANANYEFLDSEIRDLTFDSFVASERKSIAILNGAKLPGLASVASRYIENMGGRVVSVGNADKIYEKSMLIVDDKGSETVKKIVHSFGVTNVVTKGEIDLLESEISRSDIVLLFGLDSEDIL